MSVEATAAGFKLGPDSTGTVVEVAVDKEDASKWVEALEKLVAGCELFVLAVFVCVGWLMVLFRVSSIFSVDVCVVWWWWVAWWLFMAPLCRGE